MVQIKGIQKTSLIDYPGKICTILFTAGCNFRCAFCYNRDLVLNPEALPQISEDEIIGFLKERRKWIDGVSITGGEPLLYKDIGSFIAKIKCLGLSVKVDTNGTSPELLSSLIDERLIDYVAMDIKNSLGKYEETSGAKVDACKINESIEIIKCSGIEYEFRTTAVRKFHTLDDFKDISEMLKGAKMFYIQNFRPAPGLIDGSLGMEQAFKLSELNDFKRILESNINKVEIRNV